MGRGEGYALQTKCKQDIWDNMQSAYFLSTFFVIKGYANTMRIKVSKIVRRPLEHLCGQLSRTSKYNSSTCNLCQKDATNSTLMAYFQLNQQVEHTAAATRIEIKSN